MRRKEKSAILIALVCILTGLILMLLDPGPWGYLTGFILLGIGLVVQLIALGRHWSHQREVK